MSNALPNNSSASEELRSRSESQGSYNQIPEKTPPLYSISEAAILLGVSTSTLRRWEEEGRLVPVRTAGGNHRRYSEEGVKRLLTFFLS